MKSQNQEREKGEAHSSADRDRAALKWFALGAVVGALAAVGATAIFTAARTPSPATPNAGGSDGMALSDARPFAHRVAVRPQNTQGSADATVTIVEYSDFNCGFCRRFYEETLQRVINDYVATGRVRFSYKHYPLLAPSSVWKAEAAECAAAQGRFWDYHQKLFTTNILGEDEGATKRALTDLAAEIRLDVAMFTACLSAGDARRQVEEDALEGRRLAVSGTPSFLINGRPLVGAQPYEAFKAMIEEELASAPTR